MKLRIEFDIYFGPETAKYKNEDDVKYDIKERAYHVISNAFQNDGFTGDTPLEIDDYRLRVTVEKTTKKEEREQGMAFMLLTALEASQDKVELEGPYECPHCNGHFMVDVTYLDQVSDRIHCLYCDSDILIPGEDV